jgi:hypothetical protein
MDGTKECSSAGRTAVSKTARRGFESCHSCHHAEVVESGRHAILRGWWGKTRRSSNLRLGTRLQKRLCNRRGRSPAPAYALSNHRPILSAEVAKWQTRRSQKPLGITARVGSSPTFGTKSEAKSQLPAPLARHRPAGLLIRLLIRHWHSFASWLRRLPLPVSASPAPHGCKYPSSC